MGGSRLRREARTLASIGLVAPGADAPSPQKASQIAIFGAILEKKKLLNFKKRKKEEGAGG